MTQSYVRTAYLNTRKIYNTLINQTRDSEKPDHERFRFITFTFTFLTLVVISSIVVGFRWSNDGTSSWNWDQSAVIVVPAYSYLRFGNLILNTARSKHSWTMFWRSILHIYWLACLFLHGLNTVATDAESCLDIVTWFSRYTNQTLRIHRLM